MNFFHSPVGVDYINFTRYRSYKIFVLGVKFKPVLFCNTRISRLVSLLDMLPCEFWIFRKENIQIRVPGKLIIKLGVSCILALGHQPLLEQYRPEHPPGAEK